ncbi:MAG: valine--tRNA ligase ['Brassica napus' phytoplasma]|nr:MAG: valine--tRNA ligase ['Brassica napus' phytoplasma]
MQTKYDFKKVEHQRYQQWLEKKYFCANPNANKKTFTVVIPPPNVTGKLHLGHAWNNTIQDIIIRFKKMQGFDVLFLPGMDHAGIATQNKVKEQLKQEGLLTKTLSKEIFLKYAWQWKEKHAQNIRQQWQVLGLHLDYNFEKFTLDPDLSQTVQEVLVKLYQKKLIYRDYKIINWDPETKTALSNVEVNYHETEGKLYYIKYFLVDFPTNSNLSDASLVPSFLEIATTRPETMFADQALMVNPNDPRYQSFIGKKVFIPDTNIQIPVISDNYVDINFGTGVVKVTPGHDINDFEVAKRHQLKALLCMNEDGTMNDLALQYQGLDRFVCRQKLVQTLKQKGFFTKTENHLHKVGYSSISDAIIEPRLSLQWFLKTKAIAQIALKTNKINFFPLRFENIFNNWLQNIEDWCISRQLWWGHQIPAWHKGQEIKVQIESPGPEWSLDCDVLDTWFSSALWPFSTLGWPNCNAPLFQNRFPTDVLVTGYDILTFWVSKMVFQSILLTHKDPFKDVLLHGLVRDNKGQKMSKSKGNGVDPLEVVAKYGTDALRWFLTTNAAPGFDLFYDETKVASSWNFINKLWNISRFVKLNTSTLDTDFDINLLTLTQKALLTQLHLTTQKVTTLYQKYELKEIGKILYHFVWEDFANWHLEFAKHDLDQNNSNLTNLHNSQKFLVYMMKHILQLLHPFIPFVTDALYENFDNKTNITQTTLQKTSYCNLDALADFENLKNLIIKTRHLRQESNINCKLNLELEVASQFLTILQDFVNLQQALEKFFKTLQIKITNKVTNSKKTIWLIEKNLSLYIDRKTLNELNETKFESNFLQQKNTLLKEIKRSETILNNPSFLQKAASAKIEIEKKKYESYCKQYKKLLESKNNSNPLNPNKK